MMSHFDFSIPTKAAMLSASANQSKLRWFGKRVLRANQTARFKTTPTTAAVIAESAVVSLMFPRSLSMYGPPKKIQRKHGVNVTKVVRSAQMVPAIIGDKP